MVFFGVAGYYLLLEVFVHLYPVYHDLNIAREVPAMFTNDVGEVQADGFVVYFTPIK